jgi:hypothetical protein
MSSLDPVFSVKSENLSLFAGATLSIATFWLALMAEAEANSFKHSGALLSGGRCGCFVLLPRTISPGQR